MRSLVSVGVLLVVVLLSVLSAAVGMYVRSHAQCRRDCLLYGVGGAGCDCTEQGLVKRQSNFPFRYGKRAARTRKAKEPFRYGKRFAPDEVDLDLRDR